MKIFKAILILAVILIGVLPAYASIIINEAMINPESASDTTGEWIELYNDEETNIDINQWTIKDAGTDGHLINNNGPLIVPGLGFLVLGRNADTMQNGGYTPDYAYGSGFILANTADEIILENNGIEMSRIDYLSGWPLAPGRSMAYGGNGDLNSAENWFSSPQSAEYVFGSGDYATPGYANIIPEPSSLLIWLSGLCGLFTSLKKKRNV